MLRRIGFLCVLAAALVAQNQKIPPPEKPDLPYLIHAGSLVPTEVAEAKEVKRKNEVVYTVEGANSSAKTPLAGPAFVFQDEKLSAEKLQLYKFEVRNGRREVIFSQKGKLTARSRRLNATPLGGGLFKLEVEESLENGEYGLTPEGSNQVFCFQVY
jgi:hypothetical protein